MKKSRLLEAIFKPSKKVKEQQKEQDERKRLRYDLKKALEQK